MQFGQTVQMYSALGLRQIVATLCKLAILLCLLEPCVETESKPTESSKVSAEWIHEREETALASHECSSPIVDEAVQLLWRVRESAVVANALSSSSRHILANGLRAPLTC